jgi:hypothetical protein
LEKQRQLAENILASTSENISILNSSLSDLRKQKQNEDGYWTGPYDMRVPNSVREVPWLDNCNWVDQRGAVTEMCCEDSDDGENQVKPLSKQSYLDKYAKKIDDVYWYKIIGWMDTKQ